MRLLLVAVAVALAIPVTLLVHRALASAEAEEHARRQAIADTAFAAVERELAGLLEREESRAWDEWRHLRVPEGEVQGSEGLVRSPLADLPSETFILGWFQVEPDGAIGTPLVPQDELAAALALSNPTPGARARDASVRGWIDEWLASRPARPRRPSPPPAEPEPEAWLSYDGLRESAAPAAPAAIEPSAGYGAKEDFALRKKIAPGKRRQETAAASKAEVFQKQADSGIVRNVLQRNDASSLDDADQAERRRDELGLATEGQALEPESEEKDDAGAKVSVEVEPFIGELDAAGRLVLHRLVVVAGQPYRQGLLLDLPQLTARVDPLELLAKTAATGGRFSLRADAPPRGSYAHQLRAPFDPLQAVLELPATATTKGTEIVLALAALLAVVGLLGLFAVDRMVGARLAYAERRSDFVSAVTHELKTPLAAIRLHGEMLREGIAATEEKRGDSYRTITAECERLTRLVDNVLELSRLEKGTRSVHLTAGPVEPVLREAVDILEPHARSQGFAIELEAEEGLTALFDRDALVQVVLNLIDNGLKYAKEAEHKSIELVARRDGERVALFVRDHGPGVPVRHLSRIFEPFWRGERELTRRAKGTGIGLALVRGLVERMQGEVDGRNAPDGGFEVRVSLPGSGA